MNKLEARRYIACSRGDAIVAAWISVIDEHKLPSQTPVPAEEWYQAYEELYLNDAVDPTVFQMCDVQKTFFSGSGIKPRDVDDALWNLRYAKSISSEAVDNEEYMHKRYTNDELPDRDKMFDNPSEQRSLAPMPRGPMELAAPPISTPARISAPPLPSLGSRRDVIETPSLRGRFVPPGDAPDVRSLECQNPEGSKFSRPYTEAANFAIMCCGEEVELEDTGGGEWYTGDEDDDHDTVDFEVHGRCDRCHMVFHLGTSMPVPRGMVGGDD